jgi:hypothetical protein
MLSISRGRTFGDFVTIRTKASMQDVTVAGLQEYRLPSPPSFKCTHVLRVSLFMDSQNVPCATLKRRGSWVISICLRNFVTGLFFNICTYLQVVAGCVAAKTDRLEGIIDFSQQLVRQPFIYYNSQIILKGTVA